MRRLLSLLLCCSSILSAAHARSSRELIWSPDSNMLLASPVAFEKVRVIDARDTRAHIGWLKTGAYNRYASLTTEDSLHLVLGRFATKLAMAAKHQPGELVVVLRSFWMEDKKAGEEIGTMHLRADLFRSNKGAAYRHVRSLDTFYETKSGWDVTAGVKKLATLSIADMMYAGSEPTPRSETYSLQTVTAREPAALDQWPVYTNAKPPVGIYRSLDDFLNLRRSDSSFVVKRGEPMRDEPDYSYYFRNEAGGRGAEIRPRDCFALFDGSSWFLAHRDGFSKMPQQAREFYAMQPLKGLVDEPRSAGPAGNLIIAAIASADQSKHYTWYVTRLDPEARRFVPVKRAR